MIFMQLDVFMLKIKKGKSQIDWISSRKKLLFPSCDDDAKFEEIDKVGRNDATQTTCNLVYQGLQIFF